MSLKTPRQAMEENRFVGYRPFSVISVSSVANSPI